MKKLLNWMRRQTSAKPASEVRPDVVKRSAETALTRYAKTFADLAKYDRGEKAGLSLPQ